MRRGKGTIHVFTFKEGLLAAAAHDLRLRLETFDVGLEGQEVRATFDLASLHVDGPVQGGVVDLERYDGARRAEIERNMHADVLHTARHPTARFAGQASPGGDGGYRVSGQLDLAGRSAPLSFEVRAEGGWFRASFELPPTRWGIAPYKALMGAIRLQDRIRIEAKLTDA
jgi:YceI-like domain